MRGETWQNIIKGCTLRIYKVSRLLAILKISLIPSSLPIAMPTVFVGTRPDITDFHISVKFWQFWRTIDAYEAIFLTQTFVSRSINIPKKGQIHYFNVVIYAPKHVHVVVGCPLTAHIYIHISEPEVFYLWSSSRNSPPFVPSMMYKVLSCVSMPQVYKPVDLLDITFWIKSQS